MNELKNDVVLTKAEQIVIHNEKFNVLTSKRDRVGTYYVPKEVVSKGNKVYTNYIYKNKRNQFKIPKLGLNLVFNFLLRNVKDRTPLMTYGMLQEQMRANEVKPEGVEVIDKEGGDA